ncbi:MAG: YdeI/OmpD-associated family protein [Actinomycetota bacterium]
MPDEPEVVRPRDRAAWRRWLARHHDQPAGVWLLIRKKGSAEDGVVYEEAVEEALCFGWIDSKAKTFDDDHYKQWMSPRKPTSVWSLINKGRVERLLAAGRMEASGLEAVRVAKENGSWAALEASDRLEIPEDLAAALATDPAAQRHFAAFPPSAKRIILGRIRDAKRPETRAKRIEETVRLAAENRRAGQS